MVDLKSPPRLGFTLLEAIVALVIVSVLSISLYGWLNTSYISANRAIKSLETSDVIVSARSYIEQVNPMARPNGSYSLGDFFIIWRSEPITEIVPMYNGGSVGLFDIALYRVTVELYKGEQDQRDNLVNTYTVELIGYNRSRSDI